MFFVHISLGQLLVECNRVYAVAFHVGADLVRHLFEHFFIQSSASHTLIELDELDDVSGYELAVGVSEADLVAVQLFHEGEISVAHANDDDGAGKLGQVVDGILSSRHIVDCTVCEQQEDMVGGLTLLAAHHVQEFNKQGTKVGRT